MSIVRGAWRFGSIEGVGQNEPLVVSSYSFRCPGNSKGHGVEARVGGPDEVDARRRAQAVRFGRYHRER